MLQSRVKPLSSRSASTVDNANDDDADDDAEELFSAFLPHLFPDEAHSCLGDPGQTLIYASPLYGDLCIRVPGYPALNTDTASSDIVAPANTINGAGSQSAGKINDGAGGSVEDSRRLFAHYLWGGGMVIAEGIEEADKLARDGGLKVNIDDVRIARRRKWDVRGQRVLELGAGAALPSLIAALAGADSIAITDHPSSSALYGTIQTTISRNVTSENVRRQTSVHSHEWGILPSTKDVVNPGQLASSPAMQFAAENKGRSTRIICADCLWMRDQHENLARSILWFLAPPHGGGGFSNAKEKEQDGENEDGVAWVVAGFHTGRDIVASFFETAVSMGLVVEDIWERDMNAPSELGENTRDWCPYRPEEGPENRARWCVVAFLRKRE